MIRMYARQNDGLRLMTAGANPQNALWIDLHCPTGEELALLAPLGAPIPTQTEIEAIAPSRLIRRQGPYEVLTTLLPLSGDAVAVEPPRAVTFMLTAERLVTLRHHPQPTLEGFADSAWRAAAGGFGSAQIIAGMMEQLLRQEDARLGEAGLALGALAGGLAAAKPRRPADLSGVLSGLAGQEVALDHAHLCLITLQPVLAHLIATFGENPGLRGTKQQAKMLLRDAQSLAEHRDHLAGRLAQLLTVVQARAALKGAEGYRALTLTLAVLALIFLGAVAGGCFALRAKGWL
ncbi:MAG: CorA family divalent cation transporter [Paracoccaceae bacterium]